jgi:hypothetical protein
MMLIWEGNRVEGRPRGCGIEKSRLLLLLIIIWILILILIPNLMEQEEKKKKWTTASTTCSGYNFQSVVFTAYNVQLLADIDWLKESKDTGGRVATVGVQLTAES